MSITEATIPNTHDTTTNLTSLNLNHYVKLTPLNSTSWHFQLTHILLGYSLIGFLNGSHPSPPSTITGDDGVKNQTPLILHGLNKTD
ncbi:hypothetical protein vseg_015094 [Gypsophila vaccaria]